MNRGKGLLSGSITLLIGAVIAIMSLVRGDLLPWLLIVVFTLWGLWVILILLMPYMRQAKRRRMQQQRARKLYAEGSGKSTFQVPDLETSAPDDLLLRYANHRILTYLRSLYSDVSFEWCEKNPAELVRNNGTGRIRLYGVSEFDHADISFSKDASITCDMLKIVPLTELGAKPDTGSNIPPNKQTIDPRIWYETQGRSVLETLISDLNSRGHSKLTMRENGDIYIKQGDNEIAYEHLSNFPAQVYWPRLVEVLEGCGLASEVTPQGIQVSW